VLQARLNALGFDAGRADGIFGRHADRAVRAFQREYDVPEDGIFGPRSLAALRGLRVDRPGVTSTLREELRRVERAGPTSPPSRRASASRAPRRRLPTTASGRAAPTSSMPTSSCPCTSTPTNGEARPARRPTSGGARPLESSSPRPFSRRLSRSVSGTAGRTRARIPSSRRRACRPCSSSRRS
jgi:peptidoglycan hydrolase-like protein with peptidoglycan-binding domain